MNKSMALKMAIENATPISGVTTEIFETEIQQTSNDIIFDASNINFCVGPCKSKEPEALAITLGNNTKLYQFKPYSGKRYLECDYPLSNNFSLIIKNYRICKSCNDRYMELYDEEDFDKLIKDGKNICKKLNI
jgi:hypothetical protein